MFFCASKSSKLCLQNAWLAPVESRYVLRGWMIYYHLRNKIRPGNLLRPLHFLLLLALNSCDVGIIHDQSNQETRLEIFIPLPVK